MHNKRLKKAVKIVLVLLVIWAALTLWVQYSGKEYLDTVIAEQAVAKALIVYNPDPIYDLDKEVCSSFAEGLRSRNISSTIATVKSAREQLQDFDLYVFCVNTYNWTPDWRLTNFIKTHDNLDQAKAVALTVGAGATMRAQRKLEWHLKDKGVDLLGSEMYWLLKPNDENRMKEENKKVASEMARVFGERIGQILYPH